MKRIVVAVEVSQKLQKKLNDASWRTPATAMYFCEANQTPRK